MLFTLLKDTYSFYWQNFRYFAAVMLPLVIPMELISTFLDTVWTADPMQPISLLPGIMTTLVFYPVYQAALVLAVKYRLSGETPVPKHLLQQGVKFWSSIVVVNVLFYVAMVLGLFLLVIPAVIVGVRWSLAEQNVVLHNEGPFEALNRSWQDTSAAFWIILGGSMTIGMTLFIPALTVFSWFMSAFNYAPPAVFISAVLQSLFYPLLVVFYMRIGHFIQHKE